MLRTAVLPTVFLTACLALAACGETPMGASEDAAPPADAPAGVKGPDYSGEIDVIGTEPFWSVKIRESGVALTRPDHPEVRNANPGVRLDGEQGVWDSNGVKEDEGRLVVRLTPGVCSDGMSDRVYRFYAEIWVDGETLKGCADHADQLKAQPAP
jgi:uncharacterized membrane protein